MTSASLARLGDLTEPERSITYGVVKPGPEQEDGVLFVRGSDVLGGQINIDALRTITPAVSEKYKRTLLRGGELLVSLVGNPGEVAIAPETISGANIARQVGLVALRPEVNARFVMYYLMSPRGRADLFAQTGGAVQQVINLADLKRVVVPLHSRLEQDRIADILSTYDNLIVNNRRRMALLEEAARQLYREWFVHLRFPGHERVTITDGVPEGWGKPLFGSKLAFHIGGGWGQDDHTSLESEQAYVMRGTDFEAIRRGQLAQVGLRYHKEASLAKRRLNVGDIIFEVSGGSANQPIGRTLLVTPELLEAFDDNLICASFCKRFVPTDEKLAVYLFLFLDHIRSTGELLIYKKDSASALQNFNFKAFLEGQRVIVPPAHLIEQFADLAWKLQSQASRLAVTIDPLAKARDLLLPRLMNGVVMV